VHILSYFVDYNDDRFNNKLQGLRNSRRERAKKMLNELRRLKMNIEWNRVQELAKGGTICRSHIEHELMEKGYVKSEREAFDKYIGHNYPAYVEREKLLSSEAVRLITSTKGIPVLAHPDGIMDVDTLLHAF